MIKKFDVNIQKYFKLFESTRTVELGNEEFIKILKENCKDFIKNPYIIQRNKDSYEKFTYSYVNPKQHTRTQRMDQHGGGGVISNHSLLFMDNLPSWSKYPKRANSIIGITNASSSMDFGEYAYIIIPFDGAIFGVVPDSDIWACYAKDDINGLASTRFNEGFSYDLTDMGVSDKSYDEMIESLYKAYLETDPKEFVNFYYVKPIMDYIKTYQCGDSIDDFEKGLSEFLSPTNFKSDKNFNRVSYSVMNYNQLTNVNDHREIWTESECLLMFIKKVDFPSSMDDVKKESTNIQEIFDEFIKSL